MIHNRTRSLLGVLAVGLPLAARAADRVTEVVVYPDRARVTRTAEVACGEGVSASFAGLPPAADPESFQASAEGASVQGLHHQVSTRDSAFSARVEELRKALEQDDQRLEALARKKARIESERARLRGYRTFTLARISEEMVETKPQVTSWQQAFTLLRDRAEALAAESAAADGEKMKLEHERSRKQAELARREAAQAMRHYDATVVVSCPAGKRARVSLRYMVGGASWTPAYEARADDTSGTGRVELRAFATVTQSTAEDWSDARMTLSTALPRQDATPPEIAPMPVFAQERKPPKKQLVTRSEAVQQAASAGGSGGGLTGTAMIAVEQGLSVQMAVPDPVTVPGDGTASRILFGRKSVRAAFALKAAPKMAPFVFLVGDVTNEWPFPLLPGPADVFRRGGFAGRQYIPQIAQGERFDLTFGVEEKLRARRVTLEEAKEDKGVLDKYTRHRFWYRNVIVNHLDRRATVELKEQIPVSELDDVKVDLDRKRSASGLTLDAPHGIVTWSVSLAPQEEKPVDLVFSIDVPSSYK